MIVMELDKFAQDVHENAKAHGWWDEPREVYEIIALIHDEWSEALEEDRAGRPMLWHKCFYNSGMCEHQDVHDNGGGCIGCTPELRKPEGTAVELVDGVIRIMDFLSALGMPIDNDDVEYAMQKCETLGKPVPWVVTELHNLTAQAYRAIDWTYLRMAMALALRYIEQRGLDPFEVMRQKHEYNRTRSYKHGGKAY